MVDLEPLGQRVDRVDDVVHSVDQFVDVLPVEWRDERLVQSLQRLVREVVGLMFLLADALQFRIDIGKLPDQFPQMLGTRDRVASQSFEKIEKHGVFGKEIEHELPTPNVRQNA